MPLTRQAGDIPAGPADEFATVQAAGGNWSLVFPNRLSLIRQANDATVAAMLIAADNENIISWDGANASGEFPRPRDDVQVGGVAVGGPVPGGPGGTVVTFGGDGTPNTIPNIELDPATGRQRRRPGGDDRMAVVGGMVVIQDGGNGTIDTQANNRAFAAFTAIFANDNTGLIGEADMALDDANFNWNIGGPQIVPLGNAHLSTVVIHEWGHFIGLDHTRALGPVMNVYLGAIVMNLDPDDQTGVNFLYTPDIGDAPPPYPSLVHTAIPTRMLNGVQLFQPGEGAIHLYEEPIFVQFVKSLKPSGPLVFDIREFEVMLDF